MAVCELVYDDDKTRQLIQEQYPQAKITDASDDIHSERFQVDIEGVEPKDFYIFAIKEGFALECLGFQLRMRMADKIQEVKDWVKEATGKVI